MSEELKPCPFCGGEAVACGSLAHPPMNYVRCVNCGSRSDAMPGIKARAAWNTRPDTARCERLEQALECSKIKLRRYMEVHGPDGLNPDTYVGGYAAEIDAVLRTINAALSEGGE